MRRRRKNEGRRGRDQIYMSKMKKMKPYNMQIRSFEHKQLKFLRSNKTFQIQHYTDLNFYYNKTNCHIVKFRIPLTSWATRSTKKKQSEKLQRSVLYRPPHAKLPTMEKKNPNSLKSPWWPKNTKSKKLYNIPKQKLEIQTHPEEQISKDKK